MANLKFAVTMQCLVPFLGYHHIIMILEVAIITMACVLLAGCSTYSTTTNIYILGLSYINSTKSTQDSVAGNVSNTLSDYKGSSQLEVRVGYFGMCVRQHGVIWLCSADPNGLAERIGSDNDPLDLIRATARFKDDVLFSGLLFMVIIISFAAFLMLATFPGWHEERDERTGPDVDVKPFPSRQVSQAALACTFVAAVLMLITSLWQHVASIGAAAMAEAAFFGNVKTAIGAAAMSLTWASFAIACITTIALLVMIISIVVLDRLMDD